ncbi:hypothetical protein [Pleurocapsa sp. PCC 7319]|uniref:hypothetical protein n=1 Tax=Pleurocapsa sp. PCC 7319 TaxID=118161 RepID=UPI000346748E|nr:hypothetical protein [Pleurocapsa sp. PCC 7319]
MAPLPQINQLLEPEQLEAVLDNVFHNGNINILKVIPATGRSKVSWIYYEWMGFRFATFVSFNDLIKSFYNWLETIEVALLYFWEKLAISRSVYRTVPVNSLVCHRNRVEMGVVISKHMDWRKKPTMEIDWGNEITIEDPLNLFVF